jgi:predicted HD superfamily hydrolase involved in NAD metabolism
MQDVFKGILTDFWFVNDLYEDSYNLLIFHNRRIVAEHSREVAEECKRLAKRFGVNEQLAEISGLLHDISAVFPFDKRLEVSNNLGLEVLKEEGEFPLILHQKISEVMARDIWSIDNEEVLNAISCHTTLKCNFSKLDLVLFIADKIRWDQKGIPPYIESVDKGLNISLERGAYAYIKYLMDNKSNLKVIHPWLLEAHNDLILKFNMLE